MGAREVDLGYKRRDVRVECLGAEGFEGARELRGLAEDLRS